MLTFPLLMLWLAQSPAADSPLIIAGRSLTEWRIVMSSLDLKAEESRRFVPGLIAVMDDRRTPWMTRRQAALTLGRLGPLAREAIPSLRRHLLEVDPEDSEISPQRWALQALGLFGPEARAAVPELIELLNEAGSSTITKLGCLEALSQIGSAAPEGIAAIWRTVEDHAGSTENHDQDVALGAIEALGILGGQSAAAVPVLLRVAQSDQTDLRREAMRSLGRIGPAALDAQTLLYESMLDDDDTIIRDVAAASFAQLGAVGWPLIEPLLESDNTEWRQRAAQVCGAWKSLAAKMLPKLSSLLSDPQPAVKLAACRSVRTLSSRHQEVWPILIDLLTDPDRHVRREASRELQTIVTNQPVSAAELKLLSESTNPVVRREAIRLQRIINDRSSR